VAFNCPIEDIHNALTEAHDLIVGVEGRVDGAGTILNGRLATSQTSRAVGTKILGSAVKVGTVLFHVSVRALNALALTRSISVGIVEATEPEGANISSKGPFTNPDIVFDVESGAHKATVLVTVGANIAVLATPGEVLMRVHHNVLVVIIGKELVPESSIEVESIVEDKLQTGLLLLHHGADISVEIHEYIQV